MKKFRPTNAFGLNLHENNKYDIITDMGQLYENAKYDWRGPEFKVIIAGKEVVFTSFEILGVRESE